MPILPTLDEYVADFEAVLSRDGRAALLSFPGGAAGRALRQGRARADAAGLPPGPADEPERSRAPARRGDGLCRRRFRRPDAAASLSAPLQAILCPLLCHSPLAPQLAQSCQGRDLAPVACHTDLLVTFSREGAAEERRICLDREHALMSAPRVIASQDALRAGDSLTVGHYRRPTLIERGLA